MIRIIAVGKMKDKRLAGLAEDYLRRLRRLAPVEVAELKDSSPEREDREMAARVGKGDGHTLVIAMDEKGDDLTSEEFARILGRHGSVTLLIGGADGLGPLARAQARQTLRLSSMTFTHEMARVVLLEQVYRGFSILKGMPYHRA